MLHIPLRVWEAQISNSMGILQEVLKLMLLVDLGHIVKVLTGIPSQQIFSYYVYSHLFYSFVRKY